MALGLKDFDLVLIPHPCPHPDVDTENLDKT
jgi:hypothetical protein